MSRKKAFITGASEGLGRSFAIKLAAEGWDTTAVARSEQRLEGLISALNSQSSGQHDYLIADLATDSGVNSCVERLQSRHYNLLINNAGYSRFGIYHQADIDEELKILQVNCGAIMALSHAYLRTTKPGDALINLSSITSFLPTPIQPTYVASKAFIKSFSENLWYQQRNHGVYVQALCPGVTKTEFINRAGNVSKKKFLDRFSGSPEGVIDASYKELLARKKPIVIPGFSNYMLAVFINSMPRKPLLWLLGKVSDFGLK